MPLVAAALGPRQRLATLAAGLLVGFAGCGGGGDEAEPPPTGTQTTPQPTETETAVVGMAEGRKLYLSAGCASCHGQNAEGTGLGPALPGHSEEQVIQQVRSPLDEMPAYSETQLSDEDLHEMAEYIAGLAPGEMHVEPVSLSNPTATHHWMAISAIKAGDVEDALHHVGHVIEAVEGEHLEAMEEARDLLRAGDLHEAEHPIEEMLAGRARPDLTLEEIHLRLALTVLERGDASDARHHLNHFLETARGEERERARQVLAALRAGDLHEALDGVQELLGLPHE